MLSLLRDVGARVGYGLLRDVATRDAAAAAATAVSGGGGGGGAGVVVAAVDKDDAATGAFADRLSRTFLVVGSGAIIVTL